MNENLVMQFMQQNGLHALFRRHMDPAATYVLPFMWLTMGACTERLLASFRVATGPKTIPGLMVTSFQLQDSSNQGDSMVSAGEEVS